jgi:hypothetical protein
MKFDANAELANTPEEGVTSALRVANPRQRAERCEG